MSAHLAVDLGAGSGRAFVGQLRDGRVTFHEVHRFHYQPRRLDGHLRWDMARLFEGIDQALVNAAAFAASHQQHILSAGVDSWGVDYGLLDAEGRLLEDPISYRDERTNGVMEDVFGRVPREEIFRRTGLQFLSLNTLFQLAAHVRDGLPERASRLLLVPDLCHHRLCGSQGSERTDASTTQLLHIGTGEWDGWLFDRLQLPLHLMPEVVPTGTDLGPLRPALAGAEALADIPVVAPATHDTACAVAATPLEEGTAFISSGTWSLVGVERNSPLLTDAVARANFTNEAGAFDTVCFLKNVTGLWLLESCRREWEARGRPVPLGPLLAAAGARPGFAGFVFPDDPRFFNPSSMVDELSRALAESGQPEPRDPEALAKVILDSLALRYASVIDTIEALTGTAVRRVHIVGGGSLNGYLNQATANATGRVVEAGPVEATVAGNVLAQAIAMGTFSSLADARALVRESVKTERYEPRDAPAWTEARARYAGIEERSGR